MYNKTKEMRDILRGTVDLKSDHSKYINPDSLSST